MTHYLNSTTLPYFLVVCLACVAIPVSPGKADEASLPEQITELQRELAELSKKLGTAEAEDADEEAIRSFVKQTFDLEMQIQQIRITQAESDLKKVKQQFAARMKAGDDIVNDRVAALRNPQASIKPEADDTPASVLATEGWQLWRKRDLRAAVKKFEASVAKDSSDAHALNGLGWSYLQTGQLEKAIEAFQKGRKIEPENGGILNGLGQAYQALGRIDEARDLLIESIEGINERVGEAIAVKRGLTAPWFVLVRLNIDKQKYDDAIEWAERYLKHKADDERMKDLLDQAKAGKASQQSPSPEKP